MPTDDSIGHSNINRRTFVAAAGTSGFAGLTGCMSFGNNDQSGSQGNNGNVSLSMRMFTGQATGKNKRSFKKSISKFEKKSGYTVDVKGTAQADQIVNQTQTEIQAGNPPNLVLMPAGGVLSLASKDFLAPIGDRIDSAKTFNRSDIVRKRKFDIASYKDKTYGVPVMSGHWGALYYNSKMLEKAGYDPKKPDFKTWPKFLKVAKEVKDAVGIQPVGFSGADDIQTTVQWHGFFSTTGQDSWLTDDKSDTVLDQSPGVDTAKFTEQATKEDLLPKGVSSMSAIDLRELFKAEKLFAYQTGSWEKAILDEQSDIEYGITWNPQHPDGRPSGFSGGWFFVIPKGVSNQDEAWELVEHLMKSENISKWAQLPPILTDGLKNRFSNFKDGLGRDVGNIFIEEIKNSSFPTIHPNQGKMFSAQVHAIQSIILERKGAEQAMKDLDSKIQDLL